MTLCTSANQSAICQRRWGFHTVRQCRSRTTSFSFTGCWSCRDTNGFMIRAWGPILSGWRWLYALEPISDRQTGLGFPHRAGWCRPGGLPFSSPGYRSCSDMEGCLSRGQEPILPGLTSLYAPKLISDRPAGLGFPHLAG